MSSDGSDCEIESELELFNKAGSEQWTKIIMFAIVKAFGADLVECRNEINNTLAERAGKARISQATSNLLANPVSERMMAQALEHGRITCKKPNMQLTVSVRAIGHPSPDVLAYIGELHSDLWDAAPGSELLRTRIRRSFANAVSRNVPRTVPTHVGRKSKEDREQIRQAAIEDLLQPKTSKVPRRKALRRKRAKTTAAATRNSRQKRGRSVSEDELPESELEDDAMETDEEIDAGVVSKVPEPEQAAAGKTRICPKRRCVVAVQQQMKARVEHHPLRRGSSELFSAPPPPPREISLAGLSKPVPSIDLDGSDISSEGSPHEDERGTQSLLFDYVSDAVTVPAFNVENFRWL
eukprot:TRINITY_DN10723_c0_g1_i1.p1 TRINITY_DN10723_c0_g1~~TRINITY_DN10723_c0_g1_i1.p1  ORF type:complete len:352 (-),score=53.47 TRINITY_DN10723_c0_g1_i1:76-1131(-)